MLYRKWHNFILRLEKGITRLWKREKNTAMKSYAIHRDVFTTWLALVRLFERCAGVGCHGNGKVHQQKDDVRCRRQACRRAGRTTWVSVSVCVRVRPTKAVIDTECNSLKWAAAFRRKHVPRGVEEPTQLSFIYTSPAERRHDLVLLQVFCQTGNRSALLLGAVKVLRSAGLQHPLLVSVSGSLYRSGKFLAFIDRRLY